MVLDAVSNFVRGNTDAAIASGDTTISVADASIFPDPATDGEFNVVIWNASNFPRPDQDANVEIVRVTGRDTGTNELTVTRAQETTSDVAHPEGSAVHLSPTAKMFTDIEDTFTTEAEAADAAPVQSVFGRVGDVVAEAGDYTATQISNFGSEVLSSIDGSSISPSDITGLWDGSVVTADVDNQSVSTERLESNAVVENDSPIIKPWTFEGVDADDRLDNALAAASDGDVIQLENEIYFDDRTISGRLSIIGTDGSFGGGFIDSATWTLNDRIQLVNVGLANNLSSGEVVLNNRFCVITHAITSNDVTITVSADDVVISELRGFGGGSVLFEEGTSGGIIDTSSNVSVTDNGTNTVGDIA